MKPYKPSFIAAAMALASLLLDPQLALAAATGEKTPLNLKDAPSTGHVGGGGALLRPTLGLAVVIGVIYGLYWILKQVKSSREEKASGTGLTPLATLPLAAHRSLQLERAGRECDIGARCSSCGPGASSTSSASPSTASRLCGRTARRRPTPRVCSTSRPTRTTRI